MRLYLMQPLILVWVCYCLSQRSWIRRLTHMLSSLNRRHQRRFARIRLHKVRPNRLHHLI